MPANPKGSGRKCGYGPEIFQQVSDYLDNWEPFTVDKDGKRIPNGAPCERQIAKAIGINCFTFANWCDQFADLRNLIKTHEVKCLREGFNTNALCGDWSAPVSIFAAKNFLGMADIQTIETISDGDLDERIASIEKRIAEAEGNQAGAGAAEPHP
jgi:hypothetical protein